MPVCPRCQHQVKATDLVCGYCGLQLKAHGHPSIELHRTTGGDVLCKTCAYDADDTCTFPQRPYATTCTLYQSITAEAERAQGEVRSRSQAASFRSVWQRYKLGIILLAIFGVSVLLTLLT
ncbi:zinc ribbon domain-containing protein [Oscillatoria sp. CS-180]|uniref:zinc ribbon domain-containing protein n=1 Tax=Oscillatoria sp. CS-180 TaxID=3021720 RepID=UPI00232EE483|nr:zinc ribbon domain-containing protein [Oscillatoria sp. CS-180]MDB9528412.1 zinc ribbon domain-containing protein [Oscillatoria sp. CS-180]